MSTEITLTSDLERRFFEACKRHDTTYMYSDDPHAYRKGVESRREIDKIAKQLPRERAVQIWNHVVDQKLTAPHNTQFHWS